jgi:hypothetical protein
MGVDRDVASADRMGSIGTGFIYYISFDASAVKKNLPCNIGAASKLEKKKYDYDDETPLPRQKSSKQERKKKKLCHWVTYFATRSSCVGGRGRFSQRGGIQNNGPTRGQSTSTAIRIVSLHVDSLPHIPEPAFCSLLILSGMDMIRTWFVGSFSKIKVLRVRLKTVFQ